MSNSPELIMHRAVRWPLCAHLHMHAPQGVTTTTNHDSSKSSSHFGGIVFRRFPQKSPSEEEAKTTNPLSVKSRRAGGHRCQSAGLEGDWRGDLVDGGEHQGLEVA